MESCHAVREPGQIGRNQVPAGASVRLAGGKIAVLDGPFTESKEIIGGYAVFELNSKEEANRNQDEPKNDGKPAGDFEFP